MKIVPIVTCLTFGWAALAAGCSSNTGAAGAPLVSHPDVPGTVFTVIFENEDADKLITPDNPFFWQLASQYARPLAYTSSTHPSLPNYIMLTSGSTNGVTTDNDPRDNVSVGGTANLADQLDAAGIPWRAYMEDMGEPCKIDSAGEYSAHHNPFLYYASMRANPDRCAQKVVDFQANFAADLAADTYRYMWITPNMCNNVHNCPTQAGDAWLKTVVTEIMDSPGYKRGGAIFVLTDEGSTRYLSASTNLPIIVVSPQLVSTPFQTTTPFDHRSYVATIEDIFDLPRLATTESATSMDELFLEKPTTTTPP